MEEEQDYGEVVQTPASAYYKDGLPQWLLSAAAKAGRPIRGRNVEWNSLSCSWQLGAPAE